MKNLSIIIDFDSTFVSVEALDVLAEISLRDHPKKESIIREIKEITNLGMTGKISFSQSLKKRLSLFRPKKDDLDQLVKILKKSITPSIKRNKEFFKKFSQKIYIISGGFFDYIFPVFKGWGIKKDHILANKFIFNAKGEVIGFDETNPLAQDEGKIKVLDKLKLKGEIYVIGDGFTDYQIKQKGKAKKFYIFCENVKRENLLDKADYILPNFDEFLYLFNLPRAYYYPPHRIKVLLLERIHQRAVEVFTREGYQVETIPQALEEKELLEKIDRVSVLGIRSRTKLTKKILEKGKKLLAVGVFAVGVDNVDLEEAANLGIPVFNAPYASGRSVAELVIGEIIALSRGLTDKNNLLHQGIWQKQADGSFEIRGKKLGIIGYGNIGSQVGLMAESLGMEVYFYDIVDRPAFGKAKKCHHLKELLKTSDYISVHIDGRKENQNFINREKFLLMKNGVYFLNLSRGFVVDIEALVEFIKNGKIAGAAIDVFPQEPKKIGEKFTSPLQGLKNVILTPHIGGSTLEAQMNIGQFVAEKVINFINLGETLSSVNFPNLSLPKLDRYHRLIHIHKNQPGVLAKINRVLASYSINIERQYLTTKDNIGYVITDVNRFYNQKAINRLKKIKETIKLRVLY